MKIDIGPVHIDTEGQPFWSYIICSVALLVLCTLVGVALIVGFKYGNIVIHEAKTVPVVTPGK